MSTGIRAKFYHSKVWYRTAQAYKKSVGGLCERCFKKGILEPGVIVHHKEYLTDQNLNNLDISLSFDNLELLCRQCHADEHTAPSVKKRQQTKRWLINNYGELVISDSKEDLQPIDKEQE